MKRLMIGMLACLAPLQAHSDPAESLQAEVRCRPTDARRVYDCTIHLHDTRSGASVPGARLTVGADMPSMPMVHNVRPAAAIAGDAPGSYRVQLALPMQGVWNLQLRISSPVQRQITKTMDFGRLR